MVGCLSVSLPVCLFVYVEGEEEGRGEEERGGELRRRKRGRRRRSSVKEACPLISSSKAGPNAGGKGSDVMVEIDAVVLGTVSGS